MREQRLERVGIGHGDIGADIQRRRHPQYLRKAQRLQAANRDPTDIQLPPPHRKPCRAREGMMVVMQFFAADPQRPRREVGGGVGRLEIAIAPPVAQAIDHTGSPERNPRHLDRPQRNPRQSEQHGIDDQQRNRAGIGMRRVQMPLDPVARRALAVLLDIGALRPCLAVQLHAAPEHLRDALGLRTMRVFLGLDLGVMLAMDRHPFAGDHRGGQPGPEAKEMRDDRMEIHTAMRLAAMQVQGHCKDGELGEDQQHRQHAPHAQPCHAGGQNVDDRIGQHRHLHSSALHLMQT